MELLTLAQKAPAAKLMLEHEMGELFKVLGFCTGSPWPARGFAAGDRLHAL
jgi:SAM-dependent MidA family methyltransferase